MERRPPHTPGTRGGELGRSGAEGARLLGTRPGEKAHANHVDDVDLDLALAVLAAVGGDRPLDVMLEAKAKEAAVLRQLVRLGRL